MERNCTFMASGLHECVMMVHKWMPNFTKQPKRTKMDAKRTAAAINGRELHDYDELVPYMYRDVTCTYMDDKLHETGKYMKHYTTSPKLGQVT